MFTAVANAVIDTIQDSKKQFLSTFISNTEVAKIMGEFIDSQTAYTKVAVAVAIDTTAKLAKIAGSKDYFGGK